MTADKNLSPLTEFIKESFKGEIRDDLFTKRAYSVDASIFEIEPVAVATPKDLSDLKRCVEACSKFNTPLIARGAATGITGGCLGRGLIVDLSKYFNHIIEINYDQEYAIVEPGVVQDTLNCALSAKGYRLGPDTSTGDRATIGGMLANNSAGARSLRYGKMADHVEEVELLLSDGSLISFGRVAIEKLSEKMAKDNREAAIYRSVASIREDYKSEIEKRFPQIPRRVSGYNLDLLLKDTSVNLAKLIAGSEGTLGIATKIKLRIAKKPQKSSLLLLFFDDLVRAMDLVTAVLKHSPLSFEMIDKKILSAAKRLPHLAAKIEWLKKDPEAVFVIEMDAESKEEVRKKLEEIQTEFNQTPSLILEEDEAIKGVFEVRKAGLGLLLSKRSFARAVAFIEDLSLPPDKLAPFMKKFTAYLKSLGKEAGIYGHVGAGCMHIRPYMDLRVPSEIALMQKMMEEISSLVLESGGALSGEHGDGLIRSWLTKKMFGAKIYEAFCLIKNAFDPSHLMNPGKITDGPGIKDNLRAIYSREKFDTFLDFSKEGGFMLAADLCNGNALCRKSEALMCPSFQATQDEFDSTRGRAQALRAIVNGKVAPENLFGKPLQEILDLCLSCKGCKAECPSQVDMAKMKAEALYQYKKVHGSTLRDKIFGFIGKFNCYTFPAGTFFNKVLSTRLFKFFLDKMGISKMRPLPELAEERFSKNAAKNKVETSPSRAKRIVLFSDTFTEFNSPKIGFDAMKVLESLGYSVEVPPWECCGRTGLSKGFLDAAKKQANLVIDKLFPYAEQGISIVVLEPSCLSAIKDDYEALLSPKDKHQKDRLKAVIRQTVSFEDVLVKHIRNGKLPFVKTPVVERIVFHTHCHEKALYGSKNLQTAFKALGGEVVEIEAGCCGLAGSFGYEKEHYELSMKIGALKLFPAIKKESEKTWISANGTSCRHQIEHGTARKARHIAEIAATTL